MTVSAVYVVFCDDCGAFSDDCGIPPSASTPPPELRRLLAEFGWTHNGRGVDRCPACSAKPRPGPRRPPPRR